MDNNVSVSEIRNVLESKYKLKLVFEKENYVAYDFNGKRVEIEKKTLYLSKLACPIKIAKIKTLQDVNDFMEMIKNEKKDIERD